MSRPRGTGSVYLVPGSRYWHIKYYLNGEPIRESSKSQVKAVAVELLKTRHAEMGRGVDPSVASKLSYEDIRKAMLERYANEERKSLRKTKDGKPTVWHLSALDEYFSGMKVSVIKYAFQGYINKQRAASLTNPTIKRHLNVLRAMFKSAKERYGLEAIPTFPHLADSKPRQGFVEPERFRKILAKLPKHLHPLLVLLYTTGIRVGEAKSITWDQVDLNAVNKDGKPRPVIRIAGVQAKNSQPHTLPIDDELLPMLVKLSRKNGPVFNTLNLRKEWEKARIAAGFSATVLHDFRRSAVRNMRKAGVSESVAMKVSGHKTAAIFRRYDIISDDDLHEAMEAVKSNGHSTVTVSQ
jgi:integrase